MSLGRTESLDVRVYYEDTDFSGRVYHASYLISEIFGAREDGVAPPARVRTSRNRRKRRGHFRGAQPPNRLFGAGVDGRSAKS